MGNPNLILVKSFLYAHIFTTQKLTGTLTEFSDSYLRKNKNTVLKKKTLNFKTL